MYEPSHALLASCADDVFSAAHVDRLDALENRASRMGERLDDRGRMKDRVDTLACIEDVSIAPHIALEPPYPWFRRAAAGLVEHCDGAALRAQRVDEVAAEVSAASRHEAGLFIEWRQR